MVQPILLKSLYIYKSCWLVEKVIKLLNLEFIFYLDVIWNTFLIIFVSGVELIFISWIGFNDHQYNFFVNIASLLIT